MNIAEKIGVLTTGAFPCDKAPAFDEKRRRGPL